MRSRLLIVFGIVMSVLAVGRTGASRAEQPAPSPAAAATTTAPAAKVRVGVYDPRAISVAYVHSDLHGATMRGKMAEMKRAEAAGDEKKVKELKAWGEAQQRWRHLQGFCAMPVDDILEQVKDKLPAVAKAANVDVIARRADFSAADVEVVDVTDEMVKLFAPDDRVWRIVRDLRNKPPLPVSSVEAAERHGKL